jgi:eukaryotic-like serine/threonine-protein kinase
LALTPGFRLGVYELTARIGEGGMGQVFRARDTRLDRDVAIKILPEAFAHDADRLTRFAREAKTLASLNHPHIAGIYGLEESGDVTALVMELVEGDDLSKRIARGAIPLDEALPIARQIAEALEAAHEQGVIHRDLKPANIKVRDDGTVKVLDFSLAKATEPATGSSPSLSMTPTLTTPAMTQAGIVLGTAAYMSPEQAKGKAVDKRADIWAFGIVLFEMVAGTRPFGGDTIAETLASVLKDAPAWERLPPLPAPVRRVLTRCLEKDPRDRLRDIGDAGPDLAEAAASSPAEVALVAPRRWRARLAFVALALMTVGLALPALRHVQEPAIPQLPRMHFAIDAPQGVDRLMTPVVSPDGRWLAFAALGERARTPSLWLRRIDGADAERLAGADGLLGAPFWAPDAQTLGFVLPGGALKRLDVTVAALPGLNLVNSTRLGCTWGADDILLCGIGSALYRVSANGGEPVVLTATGIPPGAETLFPEFLPDGKRFLFLSRGDRPDTQAIYRASLDGGLAQRLFPAESQAMYAETSSGIGHVLSVRNGSLLAQRFDLRSGVQSDVPLALAERVPSYNDVTRGRAHFSVSKAGLVVYSARPGPMDEAQKLTWFDRRGEVMGVLGDTDLYRSPRLSRDAKRLAVARLDPNTQNGDIYVLEVEQGGTLRLTFDPADDNYPVWLPDGSQIIWAAHRNGKYQLLRKRADGGGPEELLIESASSLVPDDISPDGKALVYRVADPMTNNDLWILMLDHSAPPRAIVQTPADEPRARFSANGSLITYISNESGTFHAYAQPFPSMDGKWQVSAGIGSQPPEWRRDGKEFAYGDGQFLWARTVITANPLRLAEPERLFALPATPRGSYFTMSPNGSRFLFAVSQPELQAKQYQVMVNGLEELKR